MLLSTLLEAVKTEPALGNLDVDVLTRFIDLSRLLRTQISHLQPQYSIAPPPQLPVNMHEFIQLSLNIPDDTTKIAWAALKALVWEGGSAKPEHMIQYLPLFLCFGLSRNICECYITLILMRYLFE